MTLSQKAYRTQTLFHIEVTNPTDIATEAINMTVDLQKKKTLKKSRKNYISLICPLASSRLPKRRSAT